MHSPLHEQLTNEIYAIIALARPIIEAIERRDRDLGSQARRALNSTALNSTALNTAEGLGCRAGHARNRFQTAHGSLFEVTSALRAAIAWRHVTERDCAEVLQRLHAFGGRLYGLMRR